jgi:hypothetical protein
MAIAKEIAKFLCGAEAFHAIAHTYLWLSGTTLTILEVTATPEISMISAGVNGAIAIALGIYGWGCSECGKDKDQSSRL